MAPRILIADDEPSTTELLAIFLAHHGFEVAQAYDGLEALVRAREQPPDLALLDVMMPGLDGRDVCRALKADPALAGVPVILHSSADEVDVAWQAVGADAFLQKPFNIRQLPDFLRRHVRARSNP